MTGDPGGGGSRMILEEPSISAYAIAKRLCPEEKKFSSFKIKILRIYKKIIQDVNLCDEVDSSQQDPFNPEDYNRLNGDEEFPSCTNP